jgi:hypothetical protein
VVVVGMSRDDSIVVYRSKVSGRQASWRHGRDSESRNE